MELPNALVSNANTAQTYRPRHVQTYKVDAKSRVFLKIPALIPSLRATTSHQM